MKRNSSLWKKTFFSALLACAAGGSQAALAPFSVLPTPENNPYASYAVYPDATGVPRQAIMMNGIPIAIKYDDFWSYSAKVLSAIQGDTNPTNFIPTATFGTYNFTVGTGTIAVNLATNAGGATNLNPNGSGVNFQDPINISSSNVDKGWTGVWGGLTQSYTENPASNQSYSDPAAQQGGTTTVGNMLTYLHTLNPLASIPVIYADYNQTGSVDSLWVTAKVEVWDSTMTTRKGFWQLDTLTNNAWDETSPTFNYATINFYGSQAACTAAGPYNPITGTGCAGVTTNGDSYVGLDHNKGSGKPDFLVYSPDMDLNQFLASDLFVFTANIGCYGGVGPYTGTANLGCNTNGGEEFGIIGAIAPQQVPEPGSLALLGLGFGVLGWTVRRRRSN